MADPIFIAVAVLTVGTAIIALEARELIYGNLACDLDAWYCRLFPSIRRAIRSNVPNISLCWRCCSTYHIHSHVSENPSALYHKGRQEEKRRRYCTDADNNVKSWSAFAYVGAQRPVWRL